MRKIILILSSSMSLLCCNSRENYVDKGLVAEPMGERKFAIVEVLPFAHSQDKDLKEDFKRAFEKYQNELDVTAVILTARRWAEKKDFNGRPVYRERLAAVTAAKSNRCYVQHFSFRQDYVGDDYEDRSYVYEEYGWKEFDCSLQ